MFCVPYTFMALIFSQYICIVYFVHPHVTEICILS